MGKINIQNIVQEELSNLTEKQKRDLLHDLEESKVTPAKVSKAFTKVAEISKLMILNLKKYKSASDSDKPKFKKIAGDLTKKKKTAESEANKLITQLDRNVELSLEGIRDIVGEEFDRLNEEKGVPHYTKDGKEWTGPMHKMPDGKLMTQDPHNDDSEELFHKEDLTEAEKYITNKFKVGDTIKLLKYNWKVTEINFKPGKSYRDSFTFVDGKQVPIKSPPTNKNAIGYKLEDGSDSAFYHCYKSGSGKTIMKLAVKGFNESVTEALARGLKPLLTIGTKISSKVGENALIKLSDKFDKIDDEQADDIASHLNMGIELMQDRSPSEARGWLKKFNIACKDALSGKSVKSAMEGVNESMIGIKTKANFKPLQLKGALDRAKIKGYQMNRLSVTLTALKLDKKDFDGAKKIIDDLGLKVMMAKESVNEADDYWKKFDEKQRLMGDMMDVEQEMMNITATLKQTHKNMEQEAEPEGGPKATQYGKQLDKYEKMYKQRKAEFKKMVAKLDKMEQN